MCIRVRRLSLLLVAFGIMMFTQTFETLRANPVTTNVSQYTLANGLQLVVVPDNRAPVVTHFVWYRVGSADEPPGVSGIAHFLEHLMFKSTDKIGPGEFAKTIARLGGQDNAFTAHDYTTYFQRISKHQLKTVMGMEADRMVNLRLTDKEVSTEREVILEERRSRTENNPSTILSEQMSATLYQNHPYRIPIIGWMHEMKQLSRQDALTFYKRFYAPNNAIVVVTGDVVPEEVRALAEEVYGDLKPNPEITARRRPQEPQQRAARRVELKDPRAGNPQLRRFYLAPSYVRAEKGEGEALYVLMKIAGAGSTSRLYQRLVTEAKLATTAGGWYSGANLDNGSIGIYATAAQGVDLAKVEQAVDSVLQDLRDRPVAADELERAKKAFIAEFIYESDSQSTLAMRYGKGLVLGQTVEEINNWPTAVARVTAEDVQKVAGKYLDMRSSVTGTLLPDAPATGIPAAKSSTPTTKKS
jgi:zinc protease